MAATLALALAAPVRAELRISDLEVFLNDHEVTVHVVLLGALAEAIHEGIQSGIPVHVRFTIQLWQYNPYWRDQLLVTLHRPSNVDEPRQLRRARGVGDEQYARVAVAVAKQARAQTWFGAEPKRRVAICQ